MVGQKVSLFIVAIATTCNNNVAIWNLYHSNLRWTYIKNNIGSPPKVVASMKNCKFISA